MTEEAPKPSIQATPDTFGMVVAAVFNIQEKIGNQTKAVETLNAHHMEQREDMRILEALLEKKTLELTTAMQSMSRTMYAGWLLLIVIGGIASFTIYRVWEIILPLLQLKLGLPTR